MEQKNNLSSKIITLNFRQNNYQFSSEIIKPINTFYNEVCSYLQIDPNNFDLYYNNKKLSINNNNNLTLSNIIYTDKEPFFKIIQKKNRTPYKLNLRYETIDTNEKNILSQRKKMPKFLTISTNDKKQRLNNLRYNNINNNNNKIMENIGVIINQIPSVQDIESILQDFNNKQNNICPSAPGISLST